MASVLIVDDEQETADMIKMSFDMQGFPCWAARNSDEALKVMAEQVPNLVLLDKRLDGSRLDGFGILQEVSKLSIRSKMKIYIVTGYPDEETEAKAKELGADGYLVKPLPINKLIEIAKSL
ncbi:MAG: response regulator [Candidatus Omnitrophica bacterium]|nr:response regulator [Candidatus Omnitrophota bacterium]